MKIYKTSLVYIFIALAIAIATYFNYISLIEAYGGGPPYYSRTTNIDKWSNPIPILIVADILVLAFCFLCFYFLKKPNKPPVTLIKKD